MKNLILVVAVLLMTSCSSGGQVLPEPYEVNLNRHDFTCSDPRQIAWCEGHNRNKMDCECVDRRELENIILSPAYMGMGIF